MIYKVGQQKKYINISEGKKDFDITVVLKPTNESIQYQMSIVSSEDIMQDDIDLPFVKGTKTLRVQKTDSSEDWFVAMKALSEIDMEVNFFQTTGKISSDSNSSKNGNTTWIMLALIVLIVLSVGAWFFWKKKKRQNIGFTSKVSGGF